MGHVLLGYPKTGVGNTDGNEIVCTRNRDRDAALLNEKFPQYPASTSPIEVGTTVIIEIRTVRVSSSGV